MKGFTDDLSVFSSSRKNHVAASHSIAKHYSDMELTLKPPKGVSFVCDDKKILSNITFPIGDGSTKNISTRPMKFLGHTLCHSLPATAKESGKSFVNSFREKLVKLDSSLIIREYKLWILCKFFILSFHFILSVDVIPQSSIKKLGLSVLERSSIGLATPRESRML